MDSDTIIEAYLNKHEFYHFEGETGVQNLNELCSDLGYTSRAFETATSLEQFLADNPGAQEAIIDWLRNRPLVETEKLLEVTGPIKDEDEDIEFEFDEDEVEHNVTLFCQDGDTIRIIGSIGNTTDIEGAKRFLMDQHWNEQMIKNGCKPIWDIT